VKQSNKLRKRHKTSKETTVKCMTWKIITSKYFWCPHQ